MIALDSAFQTLAVSTHSRVQLHLLDFPHELLSSILEHLSFASDRKTLSTCARLCKRLHPPSQEHLYALWAPNTSCESDTIESLKHLSALLDDSPHLGQCIKSFWVFLGGLSDSAYSPTTMMYFGHSHRPSYSFDKPSTPSNAYQYIARILPRLTCLTTLFIKPLGYEVATVQWTSQVDVPQEVRNALGRALGGANLDRVIIESVDRFDLGVFREVERIKTLELYGTTLAERPQLDEDDAAADTRLNIKTNRCRLGAITYYLGPGNLPSAFVEYCIDDQRCVFSFDSLTHLHLRDPADRAGPSPLTGLLNHCSSTLVHLELLYNTEIDSRWEPPSLASLAYLKSLRLTLWLSPSFLRLPEITHQDRCQQVLRLLGTLNTDSTSTFTHQEAKVPLSLITISFNVRHRFDVVDKLLNKHKWDRLDEGLASLKKDGLENLKEVEMIYRAKVAKDMTWKRFGEEATLPKLNELGVDVSLSMESLF